MPLNACALHACRLIARSHAVCVRSLLGMLPCVVCSTFGRCTPPGPFSTMQPARAHMLAPLCV